MTSTWPVSATLATIHEKEVPPFAVVIFSKLIIFPDGEVIPAFIVAFAMGSPVTESETLTIAVWRFPTEIGFLSSITAIDNGVGVVGKFEVGFAKLVLSNNFTSVVLRLDFSDIFVSTRVQSCI